MSSSYSPNKSQIDSIISEATDLFVLEQIAALNTAHLSDSTLNPNLESRFKKLKSFPSSQHIPSSSTHSENIDSSDESKAEIFSNSSPKERRRSPSPTRVVCCFGCSPRKMVQRRKGKNGEEIFLDFGVSSMKEQRRKLERVLKEQERASREVEKMVEVMEEAAARMNFEAFDELMSDNGEEDCK